MNESQRANNFESAVLDAGYDGYLVRRPDIAVVLDRDVKVDYLGQVWQTERIQLSIAEDSFAEDMAQQTEFLEGTAITNGYASLDDFVADDPAAFAAASAEWRDNHPRAGFSLAAPTFYSTLQTEIEKVSSKAAPAAGWKSTIKGLIGKGAIKAAEVEWTGPRVFRCRRRLLHGWTA